MAKKKQNPQQNVPQGLHFMLAKKPDALHAFYQMEEGARNEIIAQAKQVNSKEEMEALVSHIDGTGLVK